MSRFELRLDEVDIPLSVSCGQTFRWRQLDPNHWVGLDGGGWYRVEICDDRQIVETSTTIELARKYFGLDRPEFEAGMCDELQELRSALPGLRILHQSCPLEVLFSFLCTSNNHVSRIASMVRKLAAAGQACKHIAGEHHWPELDELAKIEESALRSQGFGYRAKTLPLVARALAEHGGTDRLENLDDAALRLDLQSLPGVGPKLADCIMLYAFHRRASVPIDTHLWRAYCQRYEPHLAGLAITPKRYSEAANAIRARFGDHAGEAQLLIFAHELFGPRGRGTKPVHCRA